MPRRDPAGRLCLCLALCLIGSTPAAAAVLELPKASLKAEKKLSRWLTGEKTVRKRIARLQTQTAAAGTADYALPTALTDRDLKDAVTDAQASAGKAREPGGSRPIGCRDFSDCRMPTLELDTQSGDRLEPAILAMLRPWLLLAEFRGQHLVLTCARESAGPELFSMSIPSFDLVDVRLNVEARPGGGTHVWFDRGLELAEIYSRQRGASDHAAFPL
jgi:hypothetical protein